MTTFFASAFACNGALGSFFWPFFNVVVDDLAVVADFFVTLLVVFLLEPALADILLIFEENGINQSENVKRESDSKKKNKWKNHEDIFHRVRLYRIKPNQLIQLESQKEKNKEDEEKYLQLEKRIT